MTALFFFAVCFHGKASQDFLLAWQSFSCKGKRKGFLLSAPTATTESL